MKTRKTARIPQSFVGLALKIEKHHADLILTRTLCIAEEHYGPRIPSASTSKPGDRSSLDIRWLASFETMCRSSSHRHSPMTPT